MSIVYGTAIAERSLETIVTEVDHLIRVISRVAGKETHPVEIIPCLLRLPSWLAKWKRDGEAMFSRYTTLFTDYLDEVKAQQVRTIILIREYRIQARIVGCNRRQRGDVLRGSHSTEQREVWA